jgi:hypothetical protein
MIEVLIKKVWVRSIILYREKNRTKLKVFVEERGFQKNAKKAAFFDFSSEISIIFHIYVGYLSSGFEYF